MLHVTSEVGRLRAVLVHEPGAEVDSMVPAMMDDLLFDDILFGESAREEHGRFRRVLQVLGVEVLEAAYLLEEALENTDARGWILDMLGQEISPALRERLAGAGAEECARALVEGVRAEDTGWGGSEVDLLFELTPVPNWCFQRDPQVVLGSGVLFSAMARAARRREVLLSRAIFRFHPRFASTPVCFDPHQTDVPGGWATGLRGAHFEGGDLLVLSRDVVAIGVSERTNRTGIHQVAEALARVPEGPRWLYMVELPARRAYMHLDTVFTPVDRDACLIFPPVIAADGAESAPVYEVDLHAKLLQPRPCESILGALKPRGLDFEPIPCGGDDPLTQQREQWTDGANAFAVAPGTIFLYRRNSATADALAARGFNVVQAEDILLGREEIDLESDERTCILLSSHEISRARGGPHCLTHPLVRDDP